jgi:radical SAM protein with 4Fe4S-binding SPASM domain
VQLAARREAAYRLGMMQFSAGFMYPQGDVLFNCGAGETGCVDAYGGYQMCMLLRHPQMVYDITHGSLHEALVDNFPIWRETRASHPDYLQRCARCFLKGMCEQCPGKSWMEHGTLDTPVEYLCQVAHAQARFLDLISEGEKAWEIENWRQRIERLASKEDTGGKLAGQPLTPAC